MLAVVFAVVFVVFNGDVEETEVNCAACPEVVADVAAGLSDGVILIAQANPPRSRTINKAKPNTRLIMFSALCK